MRIARAIASIAALFAAGVAVAATPRVTAADGNIVYVDAEGASHRLTTAGGFRDPALSPDGHTVAFIHVDRPAASADQDPQTSLWIGDGPTGTARRLIGPRADNDPKLAFDSFGGPVFSLDGGFVYVTAMAWATSGAVHQVSLAAGQEHFVIEGGAGAVIRSGPWRGYLLVSRHMYRGAPNYGSYDATYVVRPDAKQLFMVPGSDRDDDGGVDHVALWLKKNGWRAW